MRIVYEDARDLKAIIQALLKLVDEALFDIKPEGIQLIAIDKAHISLIRIDLPKEMFKEYDVSDEFKFGFNTQYMNKLLKVVKRKEEIVIEADTPGEVRLVLSGSLNRVFNINNLEIIPPEVPEINLEFDVRATINATGFKNAVEEIYEVSDTLLISANEEKVIIKGEGESKVDVEFAKDTGSASSIEIVKSSTSSYDVSYLFDILSLTNLSRYISIAFAEQKPMQLEFNMEKGGGKVSYLIAPKIT